MQKKHSLVAATLLFSTAMFAGDVTGKVTVDGTVPKPKQIDMSKEPSCAKQYSTPPTTEAEVVGNANALENVVVYVSSPASDDTQPQQAVTIDQKGCRYIAHVTALKTNQELKVVNSDQTSHNIHPLAKVNREWNKSQPPGTQPLSEKFDKPEFIPVKCNVHPWMRGYIVVLQTSHSSVTGQDGKFDLKGLPPGKYTLTAWHETLGTQTQDVTVGSGESKPINFVFKAK
jgi:plastocyanin